MHSLLLLTLILVSHCALQQLDQCKCQQPQQCLQIENKSVCDCGPSQLAFDCSISSKEINQTQQIFNTSHEFQYYYIEFNASSFYITQILFCPSKFRPNTLYTVSVGFENSDGSLHQDKQNQSSFHNFTVIKDNTCFSFSGPIFTPEPKYNGKSARFIAKIKQLPHSEPINTTQTLDHGNSMKIFAMKMEYIYPSPLVVGQYIAGLSIFLLVLSSISFVICRRIFLQRITRFQPAERVMDIEHFDQIMPAIYNQASQPSESSSSNAEANTEEDECMICLLGISETYTRITPCRHLFHRQCIDEWGRKSLTCPACRSSLRPIRFQPI